MTTDNQTPLCDELVAAGKSHYMALDLARSLERQLSEARAECERLRIALESVRKAAGSCQHFTNRLQFIYERAGVALAGEQWDESWKAQYGYNVRSTLAAENESLRAKLWQAERDAERYRWLREQSFVRYALIHPSQGRWPASADKIDSGIDIARERGGEGHE